jgi:replicative DNA helicase
MTPSPTQDRVLPHSTEAEQSVLGSMLLDPVEAGNYVLTHLTAADFYSNAHVLIYQMIAGILAGGGLPDNVVLFQKFTDAGQIEEIGGAAYLAELVSRVPSASNVADYVEIVKEKSLRRRLVAAGYDLTAAGFNQEEALAGLLEQSEQSVFSICNAATQTNRTVSSAEAMRDAFDQLRRRLEHSGAVLGVPTGFHDLDRMLGGMLDGNVIIIGARPSVGKTALALNIARHACIDNGFPTAVFSLEMTTAEVMNRLWAQVARVNSASLRDGVVTEDMHGPLTTAGKTIVAAPLFIHSQGGMTIGQIRSRARQLAARHKLRLIVVDYLQFIRPTTQRKNDNRETEVAEVSAGLKAMAMELKLPVVVPCQLNRKSEDRTDKMPKLSDLRESGSIEQDADVVVLLHRPEQGASYEDVEKNGWAGKATAILSKQRNGPTGLIDLVYQHEYTRFESAARM